MMEDVMSGPIPTGKNLNSNRTQNRKGAVIAAIFAVFGLSIFRDLPMAACEFS